MYMMCITCVEVFSEETCYILQNFYDITFHKIKFENVNLVLKIISFTNTRQFGKFFIVVETCYIGLLSLSLKYIIV